MRRRGLLRMNSGKAVLLIVIGGLALAAYGTAMKEPRGEDGCPVTGPERNVVALLDGSDPTIDTQLDELSRSLREVAQGLGSREKLWVFVFGGADEADLIPIPGACNRVGDADWLRGRVWEADQERKFFEAIDGVVDELKESRKGNSPIVEGLDRLLFKSELFEGEGADLLIFSDMIQNTPVWSHIPGLPGYRAPSSLDFPSREGLPDRKWNSVRIYEVQRPRLRGLQSVESGRWWVDLLSMVSRTPPVIEKL